MKNALITTALTAITALSTLGFSQTAAPSPVAAPTYLGLGYSRETLHVATSSRSGAALSPLVHTLTFEEGRLGRGFEALHTHTSLSEVVAYYWGALSELGFNGSVEALSGGAVNYSFSNGAEHLDATFTQHPEGISANLVWGGAELISLAY
jgi:hypothetical protein